VITISTLINNPENCGICGVARHLCLMQDEHFGSKGESPPYSICGKCKTGFGNDYSSERQLQLHIADRHNETATPSSSKKPEEADTAKKQKVADKH
jgi:hypothetical protein